MLSLNRTRILYVIDSMANGGAETQLHRTLTRLQPDKFEAFVVLSRGAGEHYDQLAALPIVQEITVLHAERRSSIPPLIQKAFKLARTVKAVQPAIIHSWLWYSNFLCGLVRQFSLSAPLPLIVSQRGDYHARYGRLRLWLTERFIYHQADVILTNSDRIRDNLRYRYPDKRISAIRNIVNLPDLPSQSAYHDSSTWRIVSVGRLAPEKGHGYLVQALNLLKTKFNQSDFMATILGDGEKNELHRLAHRYHLSDRVELPGFRRDIFPILSNAHLFILPSLHESSSNALIEAMGVGLPCIASAVGGVLDLIDDGESGLLVPPAHPQALGKAIHRLLTDRKLAAHLGRNARLKIQQMFDNDRSIRQLEAVYGLLRELS